MLLGGMLTAAVPLVSASAQPAHNIPPSIAMEHKSMLAYLDKIAQRKTPTGAAAKHLLEVLKAHMALEDEFVLPPLSLLPVLADGTATPDMRWAIAMSDRVKAEKEKLQQSHAGITAANLSLMAAAQAEGDGRTVAFCKDVAADDLDDVEVTEPMVILLGDILRAKLPAK
jgi:hypothetical protein